MNFIIKCNNCSWTHKTTGFKKDMESENLIEIKNNCQSCGKIRKVKCKKCGMPSKMFRIIK